MNTFGHAMLASWPLEPGLTYLNHGTVGVTPRRVLEAQRQIRDEIAALVLHAAVPMHANCFQLHPSKDTSG